MTPPQSLTGFDPPLKREDDLSEFLKHYWG